MPACSLPQLANDVEEEDALTSMLDNHLQQAQPSHMFRPKHNSPQPISFLGPRFVPILCPFLYIP